jgi:hypothetical protein
MCACRSLILVLAALILLTLPAQAQTPSAPATSGKTEVNLFSPYSGRTANSDLNVTGRVTGSCAQASQVDVNRPDAWACTVAYKVYDPCFANQDGSELACPDLPSVLNPAISAGSVMSVVLVTPTDPLDQTQANTPGPDATPFLIELTDGQFCVPEPADVRYASLPIFGWCTTGYWFGPGDLSQPVWALPILQGQGTPSLSSVSNIGILRLWY